MALRIANKINRQFVKNVCRSLSTKRDITDFSEYSTRNDDAAAETGSLTPPQSPSHTPVQYQVCPPRNRSGTLMAVQGLHQQQPPRNVVQNENDVAKNAMAMQHLQPSLLPEYFKPPVEINSSIYQESANEAEKQSSLKKTRRFEESSTRLNLKLPLKAGKLANPFPGPVKVMPSDTVSDSEKAELMLAEQRMAARTAPPPPPPPHAAAQRHHEQQRMVAANGQRRHYSTKSGAGSRRRGGKPNVAGPICPDTVTKKCHRRFRMPFCAAARVGPCKKKMPAPCKKTLAPYPSYSEACYIRPYRKPTECNMCPWSLSKHPTFPSKKCKFHTESEAGISAIPQMEENQEIKNDGSVTSIMECLEKKHPCEQPNRCGKPKKPQKKQPPKPKKPCPKKKKCGEVDLGSEIGVWLNQISRKTPLLEAAEAQSALNKHVGSDCILDNMTICKGDGKCKPPCKKFPFKEDTFELVKEHTPKPRHPKPGFCPEKKRKLIKDCPPGPCGCGAMARVTCAEVDMSGGSGGALPPIGGNGGNIGYLMSDDCEKKKPPCKKFEKPVCPEKEPEKEECDWGPHPRSAYCPEDVGHALHYKRPKFVPKSPEEIDRDRENKKKKKTKSFDELLPFVLPPSPAQPSMSVPYP